MRERFLNKVQQVYVNVRSRTGNMSSAEIKTMTVRKLEDIKGVTKSRKLTKSKKAERKTLIYETFKKKIRATRTLHVHKNHIHRICIRVLRRGRQILLHHWQHWCSTGNTMFTTKVLPFSTEKPLPGYIILRFFSSVIQIHKSSLGGNESKWFVFGEFHAPGV